MERSGSGPSRGTFPQPKTLASDGMSTVEFRVRPTRTPISLVRMCRATVNDDGRTALLYPHTNIGGGLCEWDGGTSGHRSGRCRLHPTRRDAFRENRPHGPPHPARTTRDRDTKRYVSSAGGGPVRRNPGAALSTTHKSKERKNGRDTTDHDRIHVRARREAHHRGPFQSQRDHLLAQDQHRRKLGADTKTIPLRNVASVDTSTKFNLGSLVWGIVFLFVGLGCLDSSVAVAVILLLVAAANLANTMSASLVFRDPSGGANAITVSILEKDRLIQLAQEIQKLVFTDADQLRHEESMDMAQQQYTAQTNSVLIQQQMLANQQAAQQAVQPANNDVREQADTDQA